MPLLIALIFAASITATSQSFGAEGRRKPNIVVLLADDKYELGQAKIENMRKNRGKTAVSWEISNHGELRRITGNYGQLTTLCYTAAKFRRPLRETGSPAFSATRQRDTCESVAET
ncbi:MAG TPA: hypothetical protein VHC19_20715 [Pirellulales bacterium]|nr:hypothetical protein [Pirellulales bacterium]